MALDHKAAAVVVAARTFLSPADFLDHRIEAHNLAGRPKDTRTDRRAGRMREEDDDQGVVLVELDSLLSEMQSPLSAMGKVQNIVLHAVGCSLGIRFVLARRLLFVRTKQMCPGS